MDHPCYKCGQSVEDGKPFCAQCGAPQIRVEVPEPAPEAVPAGESAVPVWDGERGTFFPGIAVRSVPGQLTQTMRSCILAAGVAFGITLLGFNPFAASLGAGFLAVVFSRRRNPGTATGAAAGAKLGALTGLVFFGASTMLQMLALAVLHKGPEIRSEMIETFQKAAARYPGPELQPMLDFVKSPDGFAFMMVASLVVGGLAFVVLGGVGGALGATILRRSGRP
jgi:hypothetical protein